MQRKKDDLHASENCIFVSNNTVSLTTSCIILVVIHSVVFVCKKRNTVSMSTSCIITLLIQLVDMLTVLFCRNLSQTQSQTQSEHIRSHVKVPTIFLYQLFFSPEGVI